MARTSDWMRKDVLGLSKRLLPQEIVSAIVLINSSLKTYKEARSFVLEQVTELKNSQQKSQRKPPASQTNYMGYGNDEPYDDEYSWGSQQQEGDAGGEEWSEDTINAVIAALKGKGKPGKSQVKAKQVAVGSAMATIKGRSAPSGPRR